jgi:hypothetical protein
VHTLEALYEGPSGPEIGSFVNRLLSLREACAFVAHRDFRDRRSRLKRLVVRMEDGG